MNIYVLGSCSGTEPMENRHHTSVVLELNNRVYWFDAGENCSYSAHLAGVDLLSVSDIFISHAHMDHVGGLGNLLWTISKLVAVKHTLPKYGDVTVYTPDMRTTDAIMTILENSGLSPLRQDYKTITKRITPSVIAEDENITVEAIYNNHLSRDEESGSGSFSFRICAEGKKIVYSGDVKSFDDLLPFVEDGCDVLFAETGHHGADEICRRIVDGGYDVRRVYFYHHGRAILNNYGEELEKCRKIMPNTVFCNDGDKYYV